MNLWRRLRRHRGDQALDPELLALFNSQVRLPEQDELVRMRSRSRVAGRLVKDSASGSVFRRIALAGFGGGGLWVSLSGIAAAHKAVATVAGVSLLVGSVVAVETSGTGHSLREALGVVAPSEHAVPVPGGTTETRDPSSQPDGHTPTSAAVGSGHPDTPGNFVTHLRSDGSFTMRAILQAVAGDAITLNIDGESLTLPFSEEVQLQTPGPQGTEAPSSEASQLIDFVGHLVVVTGQCDRSDAIDETCRLTRLQVLGHAGQEPSIPENPVQPGGTGAPVDRGASGDFPDQQPGETGPPTGVPTPHTGDAGASDRLDTSTPPTGDRRP